MKDAGSALMGIGRASGENRAAIAAQQAIESPLLEVSIDGARGVLFLISGSENVTMQELQEAGKVITENVAPDANIIMGASVRPDLEDEIMVTVIATGFDSQYFHDDPRAMQQPAYSIDSKMMTEPEAQPAPVAPAMPAAPVVEDEEEDDDPRVTDTDSADFTAATSTNMWTNPAFNSGDIEENDTPAILRRKNKNK
jgi:cell division protein FtsZ